HPRVPTRLLPLMTTTPFAVSTSAAAHSLPPRIFNFSAGPAMLPESVLHQVREDVWSVLGSGIGILEHSHRGPVFDRILAAATEEFRRLAGAGDEHEVIFMPGGATMQFALIPMNFLPEDGVADYLDTGVWAHKAVGEADAVGRVNR